MDEENKPKRYHELVAIHGHLDPLVNVDMEPATQVKVRVELTKTMFPKPSPYWNAFIFLIRWKSFTRRRTWEKKWSISTKPWHNSNLCFMSGSKFLLKTWGCTTAIKSWSSSPDPKRWNGPTNAFIPTMFKMGIISSWIKKYLWPNWERTLAPGHHSAHRLIVQKFTEVLATIEPRSSLGCWALLSETNKDHLNRGQPHQYLETYLARRLHPNKKSP